MSFDIDTTPSGDSRAKRWSASGMLHALIGRRAAGSPAPTPLRIHSLGQFRLLLGDGDLAPALISRRIKGYMWLCLLARHALQPGVGFTRGILAAEAFPGLPPP